MHDFMMDVFVPYSTNLSVTIPPDTLYLTEKHCSPLASTLRGTGGWALDAVRSCVKTAMPMLSSSMVETMRTKSSEDLMVTLIVHLLMNNFVGSEDSTFEALFHHLQYFSIHQAKILLDAVSQPYSIALQQSILTISIRFNAIAIIRTLLDQGLNIDQVTCQYEGFNYNPIGLACIHRRIEIIQLFLKSLANFNKEAGQITIAGLLYPHYPKPLKPSQTQTVYDIFALLLREGACIISPELTYQWFWEDKRLVDILMAHAQVPQDVNDMRLCIRILTAAINYLESARAFQIMGIFLGHTFKLPPDLDEMLVYGFQDLLKQASFRGHDHTVYFLLDANIQPNPLCLSEAVRGNSINVVHRLLDAGVNPNSQAIRNYPALPPPPPPRPEEMDIYYPPDAKYPFVPDVPYALGFPGDVDPLLLRQSSMTSRLTTTAFAEAVRWRRTDLITLFQDMSALDNDSRLMQNGADALQILLAAAIEAGNMTMVETVLKKSSRPEIFSNLTLDGIQVCMCLAILGGHDDIFNRFLHDGWLPDDRVVSAALLVRNPTALRICLDIGVLLHSSVVWLAVRWGKVDVVRDLIVAGASFTSYAETILLVNRRSHFDHQCTTPLGEALQTKNYALVQLLLDLGAGPMDPIKHARPGSRSALTIAVELGDTHLVREILSRGVDPNDAEALHVATLKDPELTNIILDAFNCKYPNSKMPLCNGILSDAIDDGNVELVRLYAKYADFNCMEGDLVLSLLGSAIISCNLQVIAVVLQIGGDPNSIVQTRTSYNQSEGYTALLQAILTEDFTIVKLVYDSGADVNRPARLGLLRTPLQLAAELGSMEIVQFLLDHGAEVNAAPCIFGGGTALQLAAIKGYVGMVELLLKHGANFNAPRAQFQGRTAFEGAAEHGRMDMVLFLYHRGVDLVSDGGEQIRRAIELATKNGQLAAKNLVEQISQSLPMRFLS
jgi:ankyrin repeat protein